MLIRLTYTCNRQVWNIFLINQMYVFKIIRYRLFNNSLDLLFNKVPGPTNPLLMTEVKNHPASLRTTCGQQVEFPSGCWFPRPRLPLKSIATQIPHTDLTCRKSNPGPLRARQWFCLCVKEADEQIVYGNLNSISRILNNIWHFSGQLRTFMIFIPDCYKDALKSL